VKRAIAIALVACGGEPSPPAPAAKPIAAPPSFDVDAPSDKIVGIGRNSSYACVVRASGAVDCWGSFGFGKPDPTPRRIPGVTDAIAISSDGETILRKTGQVAVHASDRVELVALDGIADVAALGTGQRGCFVHRDRTVSCLGWFGETPRKISGITDAIAVTRASSTICIVRASGEVVCGDHEQPAPFTPLAIPPVSRFVFSSDYSRSGCAIAKTGEPSCFAIDDKTFTMQPIIGFDAKLFAGATELAFAPRTGSNAPPFELCAIVDRKVACWNANGTRVIEQLADAQMLASTCAVRTQGSVVCWGENGGGSAGQPTTIGRSRRPPARVAGATNIAKIALAEGVTWAIDRAGKVFAWGSPGGGSATEIPLPDGTAATELAVTRAGNACVLAGDAIYCWTREAPKFARVASGFRALAGEYETIAALKPDGTAVRWKIDRSAGYVPEEGPRLAEEQPPPAPANTVALVAGAWPCALGADGTIGCGKTWDKVPVEPITRASTNLGDGCGITKTGGVRCWDYSFETGTSKPAWSPSLTGVTDIGLGSGDFCVVANGAVTCGIGERRRPRVMIPSGAVDVEAGGEIESYGDYGAPARAHVCAIMTDGGVMCWGTNVAGELGDGSVTYLKEPLGVRGL
jgi:hypothetical protein